jgi:hypothetical protein
MKKTFAFLAFILFMAGAVQAQIRGGIYLGAGFSGVKSDYDNVSILPIEKGGFNFSYGLHLNVAATRHIEIETGIMKVTKGFTYTASSGYTITDQYNKITTLSVPVVLLFTAGGKELPIQLALGAGAYGSYALSGKITEEDGTSQTAKFSNSKRLEIGPRVIGKIIFVRKFEVFIANDFGKTNILKSGNGYIRQSSLQIGFGCQFGK